MALSDTFSALSDPNRQKILDLLKKDDCTVTKLADKLKVTMPTISHHLDILKRNNLVSSRREGQLVFYSLNLSVFEEISKEIIKFLKS